MSRDLVTALSFDTESIVDEYLSIDDPHINISQVQGVWPKTTRSSSALIRISSKQGAWLHNSHRPAPTLASMSFSTQPQPQQGTQWTPSLNPRPGKQKAGH